MFFRLLLCKPLAQKTYISTSSVCWWITQHITSGGRPALLLWSFITFIPFTGKQPPEKTGLLQAKTTFFSLISPIFFLFIFFSRSDSCKSLSMTHQRRLLKSFDIVVKSFLFWIHLDKISLKNEGNEASRVSSWVSESQQITIAFQCDQ